MKARVRIRYLLFALVVAAFVTLYPQLDAAGYCDGDGCPKVSYSATGAANISLVVAALVAVAAVPLFRTARSNPLPGPTVLVGMDLPPDVPPPRPFA